MANDDPRARGLFGAAYAVGYFASLGLGQALPDGSGTVAIEGVAFGDSMGARGLCDADMHWCELYPSYHVVNGIGRAARSGGVLLDSACSDESIIKCLGIQTAAGKTEMWIANLTDALVTATLTCRQEGTMVSTLSAETAELAKVDPEFMQEGAGMVSAASYLGWPQLSLPAFAVARVVTN